LTKHFNKTLIFNIGIAMNQELDILIDRAFFDGILLNKERQLLYKEISELGDDMDIRLQFCGP